MFKSRLIAVAEVTFESVVTMSLRLYVEVVVAGAISTCVLANGNL